MIGWPREGDSVIKATYFALRFTDLTFSRDCTLLVQPTLLALQPAYISTGSVSLRPILVILWHTLQITPAHTILPLHIYGLLAHALYPLGPVATLRFCHLRPRCVSKQRRTTNVIISDRVWWIWCDAGLATVATRPQRSPHSVASNSRPDYFAATRSRSLFLTIIPLSHYSKNVLRTYQDH